MGGIGGKGGGAGGWSRSGAPQPLQNFATSGLTV
jgi:hypothetical protein